MAGVANPNKATFYQDQTLKRTGEVTGADWDGGCNKAGSCAGVMGLGTGDYSPKSSDWSEDERLLYNSQHMGQTASDVNFTDNSSDHNNDASFVQADGNIAANGELKSGTGALNRTGVTVPSGSWCWGEVLVA